MNILVIGNGFDLAHGLPTKYGDFLEFVKVIRQVVKIKRGETFKDVDWGNVNGKIKELIIARSMSGNQNVFPYEKICSELLNENSWIEYFLQCDMYQKENWIDFESEISRVIQSIDNDMKQKRVNESTVVHKLPVPFLSEKFLNDYESLEQERDMCASEEIRKMEEEEGTRWNIGKTSDYLKEYIEKHPLKI